MKIVISGIFAFLGLTVCTCLCVYYWPQQGLFGLVPTVLPVIFTLGITGFLSVFPAVWRKRDPHISVTWIVCGGLTAILFVTFMSIAPAVLAALVFFSVSAVLGSKLNLRNALRYSSIFCLSVLVSFMLLMTAVTHLGTRLTDIPEESSIDTIFPGEDYSDAFTVSVSPPSKAMIETIGRIAVASMRPERVELPLPEDVVRLDFTPGTLIGNWETYYKTGNEIIIGLNRSYIDLRLSVLIRRFPHHEQITLTTFARYNNWKGHLYFIPVKYGHMVVLADTIRKLKKTLRMMQ